MGGPLFWKNTFEQVTACFLNFTKWQNLTTLKTVIVNRVFSEATFSWSLFFSIKYFGCEPSPFGFTRAFSLTHRISCFGWNSIKFCLPSLAKIGYGLTVLLNILRLEKATALSNTYSWLAKCIEWSWWFVICRYPSFAVSISRLWVRLVNNKYIILDVKNIVARPNARA